MPADPGQGLDGNRLIGAAFAGAVQPRRNRRLWHIKAARHLGNTANSHNRRLQSCFRIMFNHGTMVRENVPVGNAKSYDRHVYRTA